MTKQAAVNSGRQVWWGVALILGGVLFLMDRYGALDLPPVWNLWPVVFFVIGGAKIFTPSEPKDIASGVTLVLMGVWFFANSEGWWGFSYHKTWPLILVLVGASTLLEVALERGRRAKETNHV